MKSIIACVSLQSVMRWARSPPSAYSMTRQTRSSVTWNRSKISTMFGCLRSLSSVRASMRAGASRFLACTSFITSSRAVSMSWQR